jgi:hypothetical protein
MITSQQTEKLLKGDLSISQLSFSMMVTMLKGRYARSPSQATLQSCTDDINKFLAKYESILGADLATITKL